ncbi:MAG: type II toxin-antitoxin system RelE family toxin [Thermomicrobiales bacterium]
MPEPEWRIVLLRPARRYLDRLPPDEQQRVLDALADLERDPFGAQVKPLKGRPEWSLRVGELRVLLRVDREAKQLVVTLIAPRGDVYKR